MPNGESLRQVELEDHASSFLVDIAQSLISLDSLGDDSANLRRDRSEIQLLIARLHDTQRARIGWPRETVGRDFAILKEEAHAAITRKVGAEIEIGATRAG